MRYNEEYELYIAKMRGEGLPCMDYISWQRWQVENQLFAQKYQQWQEWQKYYQYQYAEAFRRQQEEMQKEIAEWEAKCKTLEEKSAFLFRTHQAMKANDIIADHIEVEIDHDEEEIGENKPYGGEKGKLSTPKSDIDESIRRVDDLIKNNLNAEATHRNNLLDLARDEGLEVNHAGEIGL